MTSIGNKIRFFREKKNLSQEKLSELLGVSRQTIYNYENDITIPNSYDLKKLCQTLDCSYEDLLNDNEENESDVISQPSVPTYSAQNNTESQLINGVKKHWRKIYYYFFFGSIMFALIGGLIILISTIFTSNFTGQGGSADNMFETTLKVFYAFSIFDFIVAGIFLVVAIVLLILDKKKNKK